MGKSPWLLTLPLVVACSSAPPSGVCVATSDCPPGQVCADATCRKLCAANSDCDGGLVCGADNLCKAASGAPPRITGLDGDGSDDGRPDHTARRLATALHVFGTSLTGSAVQLTHSSGAPTLTLVAAATSSDARLELPLPDSLIPGEYTVSVSNAAGADQAAVLILQGEPGADGTDITGVEIISRIETARLNGSSLTADAIGSMSASGLTSAFSAVESRLTNLEGRSSGGTNLLFDTLSFRGMPTAATPTTTNSTFGPWAYFKYDDVSAVIRVIAPPAEINTLVSSAWWGHDMRVLHVAFSPGTTATGPGRLLQRALASAKTGPVTMSAWVRVVAGGITMGQEGDTLTVTNTSWQHVSHTIETPAATLGGAYGFTGLSGQLSEAYIALPKLELGEIATPYIEAQLPYQWAEGLNTGALGAQNYASGANDIVGSVKAVSVPYRGTLIVNWGVSGYADGGAAAWDLALFVGSAVTPAGRCYTNEAGSHKSCSGTALLDVEPGPQNIGLRVGIGAGNFYTDANDRAQWTVQLVR